MTTGIRDRDTLYVRLREVLGDEQAATLMELLPPDREQLATKADVLAVKTDLQEVKTDLQEVKTDLQDVKTDLQADIAELKAEVAGLKADFADMKSSMVKFDERLWEFHGALRSQTRTFVTATVSSMIGVGGLAFAAAAFI
jgi:chromosome segregation ATPase